MNDNGSRLIIDPKLSREKGWQQRAERLQREVNVLTKENEKMLAEVGNLREYIDMIGIPTPKTGYPVVIWVETEEAAKEIKAQIEAAIGQNGGENV